MTEKEQESEVIIKLKSWQVPYLLGACELGIWVEDWCASLAQTSCGTYDTHSSKWIFRVEHTTDSIKEQSGIEATEKEYGFDSFLSEIDEWVNKQCITNIKNLEEWQEADLRQTKETTFTENIKTVLSGLNKKLLGERIKKGIAVAKKRKNEIN